MTDIDLTAMTGTLDTSGTGGAVHNSVDAVSPIFAAARVLDLETAARALDPEDEEVPSSLVVVPLPVDPGHDAVAEAKDRIATSTEAARRHAENVVDPEVVPGAEDGWPSEQDDYEPEDEARQIRREAGHDAEGNYTQDPHFTDLTGTLDTTGTAYTGISDASTVSALFEEEQESIEATTEGAADGEDEEVEPYEEWVKDDLIAEAENRGLPKSGTKDDLIDRLKADDNQS